MILEQCYLGCRAHASYPVADKESAVAAVVDPQRDADAYVDDARRLGRRIGDVFLTHFHADFVAGHRTLRDRETARIHLGARATAAYEFTPLADQESLRLGQVRLEVLETPGQSPESISILVHDLAQDERRPHAVPRRDTLCTGDVGRPDLRMTRCARSQRSRSAGVKRGVGHLSQRRSRLVRFRHLPATVARRSLSPAAAQPSLVQVRWKRGPRARYAGGPSRRTPLADRCPMLDGAHALDEHRIGPGATRRREHVATVMRMRWEGVTEDQYEHAREKVGWDRDVPAGAKLHVAGFSEGGLNVLDVWESPQAFEAFSEQRLAPAVQEIGIQGEPDVRYYPMHACFAPALGRAETLSDL